MSTEYYVYGYYDEDGVCYYIGKGIDTRIHHSHNDVPLPPKGRRQYLLIDLSESEAYDEEERIVKAIGRKDLGTGPLLNKTDGGKGASGQIHSKAFRAWRSKATTAQWQDEEYRAKQMASRVWYDDDEWLKGQSETSTNLWADPQYRERVVTAQRAAKRNTQLLSDNGKAVWAAQRDYIIQRQNEGKAKKIYCDRCQRDVAAFRWNYHIQSELHKNKGVKKQYYKRKRDK